MSLEFIIREVSWQDAKTELSLVREKVFVCEQRVPVEIEQDGKDDVCFHVLVSSITGDPIATGRITRQGKIGRIAVLMPYRKHGLGSKILDKLISIAEREQLPLVKLNAQTHAIDFYSRHKFEPCGPVFMEAGIPHLSMKRHFQSHQL